MNYGVDTKMLRQYIVRPVLQGLNLWNIAAENLVMGTAMQESHCRYLHQLGKGPAVGIFQMEPFTYTDIWNTFLAFKPELSKKVTEFAIGYPDVQEMHGNLYFAAAMCRVFYYRIKEALPPSNDATALASYWKRYYNTNLGKGTVEEAYPHFKLAVEEGVP